MEQALAVTATFKDGVDRRVALTTSRPLAVQVWEQYRDRGFPAKITDNDTGNDVSPQF